MVASLTTNLLPFIFLVAMSKPNLIPLSALLLLCMMFGLLDNTGNGAAASQPQAQTQPSSRHLKPVILLFGHDRASHLRQALRSISAASSHLTSLSSSPSPPPSSTTSSTAMTSNLTSMFPAAFPLRVIVSIDDGPQYSRVLQAAQRDQIATTIWRHQLQHQHEQHRARTMDVRSRISLHYRDTLTRLFDEDPTVTHALIFEDDLRLSVDALAFLLCALPYTWPYTPATPSVSDRAIRNNDRNNIVTVSLWNDNARARQPGLWTLTSFFPGLGWALSRQLWDELRQEWPPTDPSSPSTPSSSSTSSSGGPGTANSTNSGNKKAGSSSSIVGIGWDFWMRVRFITRGWLTLTPTTPRVRHISSSSSGVASGNVMPQQQRQHFDAARAADSHSAVDWCVAFAAAPVSEDQLMSRIRSIEHTEPFDRFLFDHVATVHRLWPTPRGFYRHVLPIFDDAGSSSSDSSSNSGYPAKDDNSTNHVLLLYDRERAPRFFPHLKEKETAAAGTGSGTELRKEEKEESVKKVKNEKKTVIETKVLVARLNQSCTDACALLDFELSIGTNQNRRNGWTCTKRALDTLNDCAELRKLFGSGHTQSGHEEKGQLQTVNINVPVSRPCMDCAYETGPDLPARVWDSAPLKTSGHCLVTEMTRYDCGGRFAWTQRACACEREREMDDDLEKDSSSTSKTSVDAEKDIDFPIHDEL